MVFFKKNLGFTPCKTEQPLQGMLNLLKTKVFTLIIKHYSELADIYFSYIITKKLEKRN